MISILRRSSLLIAPEAIFFQASVADAGVPMRDPARSYDPSFHDLTYVWDFGDADGVAASDKVMNLPDRHNDLNRAYGKRVAHVFTRSGSFQVTCRLFDPEGRQIAENTLNVAVGDAARFYAGSRTILVDPDGNGDPRHPNAQVARSLDQAMGALEALGAPGRVLMRRGRVFQQPRTLAVRRGVAGFHLGAFGDGPRPVLAAQRGASYEQNALIQVTGNYAGDTVIEGIALQGLWDATTETGQQVTLVAGLQTQNKTYLMTDCTLSGAGIGVILSNVRPDTRSAMTIHNCDITAWGDYGLLMGRATTDQHLAIIGTAVHQHEEAMMGGGSTRDGQRNQHGPIRIAHGSTTYIACCDLFSRNGWSDTRGGIGADQPCLRWSTATRPTRSAGVVERVAMEGGIAMVTVGNVLPDQPVYATNVLFDKCLLVGTARTRRVFDIEYSGVTIRNCLIIRPDTPMVSERWIGAFTHRWDETALYPDRDWPVQIYSNTIVNLMSETTRNDAVLAVSTDIDEFPIFRDENNLHYAPNAPSQTIEDAQLLEEPMRTVGGTWRSRYRGVRHQDRGAGAQLQMDTRFATPDGAVRVYAPGPNSPAIDTAMGRAAADDFWGTPRGDLPDRGAFEA